MVYSLKVHPVFQSEPGTQVPDSGRSPRVWWLVWVSQVAAVYEPDSLTQRLLFGHVTHPVQPETTLVIDDSVKIEQKVVAGNDDDGVWTV